MWEGGPMELSVFMQVLRVAYVYELLLRYACNISVYVSDVNKLITIFTLAPCMLLYLFYSNQLMHSF